jgi:hypothetical protein
MMAGGNLFRQPRQASVRPDIVHKRFGGDRKRLAALRSRRTTPLLATRVPAGAASEPRYLCGPPLFAKNRNVC